MNLDDEKIAFSAYTANPTQPNPTKIVLMQRKKKKNSVIAIFSKINFAWF